VFTARYGLVPYIKQIYNRGRKCLQRGTDWFLIQSRLRLVFKRLRIMQRFVAAAYYAPEESHLASSGYDRTRNHSSFT
jgi:hypothetical protein